LFLLTLAWWSLSPAAAAKIKHFKDTQGTLHITNLEAEDQAKSGAAPAAKVSPPPGLPPDLQPPQIPRSAAAPPAEEPPEIPQKPEVQPDNEQPQEMSKSQCRILEEILAARWFAYVGAS